MKKYTKPIFGFVILFICAVIYFFTSSDRAGIKEDNPKSSLTDISVKTEEYEDESIYVYICGEIINEGVYKVNAGSRLYELIDMAGGFTEDAAADSLNQVELLSDGQKITVMSKAEAETAAVEADDNGLININTADISSLTTLTGIGEVRAKDIITYREKNGDFKSPEDIMKVPGIKDSLYSKIKDKITTG